MNRKLFLVCLILTSLFSTPAHAIKFSLVGAANNSEPKAAGITYDPVLATGGGALLEFGLGPMFGFEMGAIYVPREYEFNSFALRYTYQQKMVQFPVLLRAYLGGILSLGFGGYYSKYQGDLAIKTKNLGITTTSSMKYDTAGLTTDDYGFASSLALYLPLAPMTKLLIDGRYNIGVKDNSTAPGELIYNDMQLLVGIQIGM